MRHYRHPGLRVLVAVVLLLMVSPFVAALLAVVVIGLWHHLSVVLTVVAIRLLLSVVPGLHSLVSALVGDRAASFLVGRQR